jgi:hypothetical protein
VPDFDGCVAQREQATAPMGSVLFFSEALIHSAVDVLSERIRYSIWDFKHSRLWVIR